MARRTSLRARFDRVREFRRSWRPQPDIYDSVIVATLRNVHIAGRIDEKPGNEEVNETSSFALARIDQTVIPVHPFIMFMPAVILFLVQVTYLMGLAFALDPSESFIERRWEEWEQDTYSQLLLTVKFAMFLTLQVLNLDELLIALYGLHVVLNPCTLRNYVRESNRDWAADRLYKEPEKRGMQDLELVRFLIKWILCCVSKGMQFIIAVMALYMSTNVVLVAKSVESVIFNGLVLQFITALDEGAFSFVANSLNIDRKRYERWSPREPPPPKGRALDVVCPCMERKPRAAAGGFKLLACDGIEQPAREPEGTDSSDDLDEKGNMPLEPHREYLEEPFLRWCGCCMKENFKRCALCIGEVRDLLLFIMILCVYFYQLFDMLLAVETGVLPAVRELCILVRVRQRALTGAAVAHDIRNFGGKVFLFILDRLTPFMDLNRQTERLENITFSNMPPYENRTFRWRCEHAEPPLSYDYPMVHRFYSMLGIEEAKFLLGQHPLKILVIVGVMVSTFVVPMLTMLVLPKAYWETWSQREAHLNQMVVEACQDVAASQPLFARRRSEKDGTSSTAFQIGNAGKGP